MNTYAHNKDTLLLSTTMSWKPRMQFPPQILLQLCSGPLHFRFLLLAHYLLQTLDMMNVKLILLPALIGLINASRSNSKWIFPSDQYLYPINRQQYFHSTSLISDRTERQHCIPELDYENQVHNSREEVRSIVWRSYDWTRHIFQSTTVATYSTQRFGQSRYCSLEAFPPAFDSGMNAEAQVNIFSFRLHSAFEWIVFRNHCR